MAPLVPRLAVADDTQGTVQADRIVSKSGKVSFAKRDIVCAPSGSAEARPLGAVLEEPGLETMDTNAVRLTSIVRTGAQGYAIAAATVAFSTGQLWKGGGDVLLAGLDKDFSPRWATVIGGPAPDIPSSVTVTSDGGFAVVAQTRSLFFSPMRWLSAGPNAALLSKYSADGSLEWAQYYAPGADVGLNAVVAPATGGIVFGGAAWRDQRWAGFLIRLDNAGAQQWARAVGRDYENGIPWIEKAADGGLLLAGTRRVVRASKFEVWLAKIGDAGDVVWSKSYKLDDGDPPVFASATAAGGFIIVRASTISGSPPRSRVPVFAIDSKGDVLWAEQYEFDELVSISAVAESAAGHYLLFGGAYRDDQTAGPVTLEVDRAGRIVASTAVDLVRAASRPGRPTVTEHDPVSISREDGGGFVIMGNATSGPEEVLTKARGVRTRKDITDDMRTQLKMQLYFVRVGEDGQAGACSRPVGASQRTLAVQGEPLDLPMSEIPPEKTTFIPGSHLGIERIGPR